MSNCKAYLRQDLTTHKAIIRLPAAMWSIVEEKQKQLAGELGVPRVSRPVALQAILTEYDRNDEQYAYDPDAFDGQDLEEITPTY